MKYVIIFLIIAGLIVIAYLTFVVAVIEIVLGLVFLVIMLLALGGLWWAIKKKIK